VILAKDSLKKNSIYIHIYIIYDRADDAKGRENISKILLTQLRLLLRREPKPKPIAFRARGIKLIFEVILYIYTHKHTHTHTHIYIYVTSKLSYPGPSRSDRLST